MHTEEKKTPESLFMNNHGLVYRVLNNLPYIDSNEHDDIVQQGFMGLWKACKTFQPDKGYKFSTYASRCIYNSIVYYFRGIKKNSKNFSINTILYQGNDGSNLSIEDTLFTEMDFEDDQLDKAVISEAKKSTLLMFVADGYTQNEIASVIGKSQSYTSRLIKKEINTIRKKLEVS